MQFVICPKCSGQGEIKNEKCGFCRDLGVYGYFQDYFFYLKERFSFKNFWRQRLNKFFQKTVNLFLLLLGLGGIFILVAAIFEASIGEAVLYFEDLFDKKSSLTLIFWLSALADMYLFYRLEQDLKWEQRKVVFPAASSIPSPAEFEQALKVKNKFKIEASSAFSEKADEIFWRSWALANKLRHRQVTPLHLFASLLLHSKIKEMLIRLEADLHLLKSKVRYQLSLINRKNIEPKISLDLKKIILKAYFIASRRNKTRLGSFELLVALIEIDPLVKEILYDLEIDLERIKNVIAWISFDDELTRRKKVFAGRAFFKPRGVMNRAFTAVATPFLDQYSQDLTLLAKSGYLCIHADREKEIKQIFQFLESGKTGLVLIGEPGIGKVSLIEGLAQLMVEEDVPENLKDKRLVSLSLGSLAGGEETTIETKLKIIINEIIRAGNIVLFIEDISNIVGLKSRGGELDLADIISSYLEKWRLILFSTCPTEDYQRVLKKSSLANVLEKIIIEEPKGNQAIQILESKVGILENQHKVYFSYKAIEQAVELSSRYLPDRFLPEKGISLLEESAVYVKETRGGGSLVKKEDIAYLLSCKTKIPLTKITEKESETLLNLEKKIHQRIINQEEAVKAVSTALRRARVELRELKRPIANLLFLGPTGVGKTELAKAISEIYFGSESNMIRLDMSEYQEKSSVDRLLGAPFGRPGAERGGYLTEAVKKQPFSLLLLDEIEKAYPDILNLFLQIMEDGRLTDNSGRTVDFTNIILIATSNAGSNFIQDKIREGKEIEKIKRDLLNNELKPYFLPEFLNRFDEIIVFKPLAKEEIKQIAHLLISKLQKQLDKNGVALRATDEAIEELVDLGYDPVFGARPLRRVIQDRVNNALAEYLLRGQLKRRDIAVLEKGGKIRVVKGREL